MQETTAQAPGARSVLVIAPLALDAVASCGGTLARLTAEGVRIRYVVVYEGGVPADRLRRACRILGIAAEDVCHLRLRFGTGATEVRDNVRRVVAQWAESTTPVFVLAPSLRSPDPSDALVGRAAFDEARGHTLLCYERAAPAGGSRPVVLCLSPSQVRSKRLAGRPRRRRPGAKPQAPRGPAAEVLELARSHVDGVPPEPPTPEAT